MKIFFVAAFAVALVVHSNAQDGPSIYFSKDGGIHWTASDKGLPRDASVNHHVVHDSVIFVGTAANGMYRFENDRWQAVPNISATASIMAMTVLEGKIFVSIRGTGILTSSDGNRWKSFNENLPSEPIRVLHAHNGKLIAGGDNGIYVSINGKPWTTALTGRQVNTFASHDGNIYAGSHRGILSSSDDGETWDFTWKREAIFDFAIQKQGLAAMSAVGDVLILLANGQWLEVTPFLKFRYTVRLTPTSPSILREHIITSALIRNTIFHPLLSLPKNTKSTFMVETPKGLMLAIRKLGDGC
jgi:hypothetical protein